MTDHQKEGPPGEGAGHTPAAGHHTITRTPRGQVQPNNRVCPDPIPAQLRRRRAASYRLPPLACGKSDPWWYEPPGERGYPEAALHLLAHGLLPSADRAGLVAMWKRGGHSRRAAELIAQAWDLAA